MTYQQRATAAYTAPFLAYIGLMAVERALSLPATWLYPARLAVSVALLVFVSRPYFSLRPARPLASAALGAAVFVIWIAPDVLFAYRHFWLFENSVTGRVQTALAPALQHNGAFLALRAFGSFAVVPVLEELFWRGWMMRWLILPDFLKVPFGAFRPLAFWAVAALFASEHGPYWEVGLAAGILYGWWAIRTRSLADCVLAHAVTNTILSAYVLLAGRWEYWL